MKLKLIYLYPQVMNIYGDRGNVVCLVKRAAWRGVDLEVVEVNEGDRLPAKFDLLFMGGGQDSGQSIVAADLRSKASQIHEQIGLGLSALVVCGGYQLFGHYFKRADGDKLEGIGVFDAITKASDTRMIGNIIVESEKFGRLIGFENHSGQTVLGKNAQSLGDVVKGYGNNDSGKQEGVIYNNAIGTYLHGSFLPKNPIVADFLLKSAIFRKYHEFKFTNLAEEYVDQARAIAARRP